NNEHYDLLACTKRTGGANNWEAFIIDHRDCKIYRAVAMPFLDGYNYKQGRWWFAQNLHYTKNLIMNTAADVDGGLGTYWCFGALSFDGKPRAVNNNDTKVSGGAIACNTYGAIYGSATIMSRDGVTLAKDAFTAIDAWSVSQGICPIGWVVAGRKDWAVMFNKIEGCDDVNSEISVERNSIAEAPCHYLANTPAGSTGGSSQSIHMPALDTKIPTSLRSTLSSRRTLHADSAFFTATQAVWPWAGTGSKRSHGVRPIDYYGFSLLPGLQYLWTSKFISNGISLFVSTGTASTLERVEMFHYNHRINFFSNSTAAGYMTGLPLRCVRDIFADEGDLDFDTYTVTFNANGGTGTYSTEVFKGSSTVLPTQGSLSLPNTNFVGWATSAGGAVDANYAPGKVITPTANLTLYAVWNVTITLTKNRTTSVTVSGGGDKRYNSSVTVTAAKSNNMLVFDGWYENGGKVSSSESYPFPATKHSTLEARYNITYVKSGSHPIPDANLRNYVTGNLRVDFDSYTDAGTTYYNTNNAIKGVTSISMHYTSSSSMRVSNTEGIQYFTGLTLLKLAGGNTSYLQNYASIDLSKNTNLTNINLALGILNNMANVKLPKANKVTNLELYANNFPANTSSSKHDLRGVMNPSNAANNSLWMGMQGTRKETSGNAFYFRLNPNELTDSRWLGYLNGNSVNGGSSKTGYNTWTYYWNRD
ncbi:MAG: InlB B-repeat-containing protein, partial [Bacteroidales bacterium]